MRLEGGDSRKPTAKDIMFPVNKKLSGHASNIIAGIYYAFGISGTPPDDPKNFLFHYEEHARRTYNPDEADLYMALSDPDAVAAFDAVIDEVRQNFETIKKQGATAVENYCTRLREILKQDR